MATTTNLGRVRIVPKGAWASGTAYKILDLVTYGGGSYLCIADVTSSTTPNSDTSHWQLIASKGDKGDQGVQGIQGPKGDTGTVDTSNFYTKTEVDDKFNDISPIYNYSLTATASAGGAPLIFSFSVVTKVAITPTTPGGLAQFLYQLNNENNLDGIVAVPCNGILGDYQIISVLCSISSQIVFNCIQNGNFIPQAVNLSTISNYSIKYLSIESLN